MESNIDADLISVIMPVYNSAQFLRQSIESILGQSYSKFEFIIINDGSEDNSEEIILSYSDPRIRYFVIQPNKGIVNALNIGLEKACGKYIARMDSDDISKPKRFEIQLAFLKANKRCSIVGSNVKYIDCSGNIASGVSKVPISNDAIQIALPFFSPFAHPTVMGRREVFLKNRYKHGYLFAEDYKLWSDILCQYHGANIRQPLLYYRTYGVVTSIEKKLKRSHTVQKIQLELFYRRYKIPKSLFKSNIHLECSTPNFIKNKLKLEDIYEIEDWLFFIFFVMIKDKNASKKLLIKYISNAWINSLKRFSPSISYIRGRQNFFRFLIFVRNPRAILFFVYWLIKNR